MKLRAHAYGRTYIQTDVTYVYITHEYASTYTCVNIAEQLHSYMACAETPSSTQADLAPSQSNATLPNL